MVEFLWWGTGGLFVIVGLVLLGGWRVNRGKWVKTSVSDDLY